MSQSDIAQMIHFGSYIPYFPLAFLRIQEINSQTWRHNLAMALFCPVDSKRKELFVAKVHHRIKFIHQTRLEPTLRILTDFGIGIPAMTPITTKVIKLTDRRTTHLHPRLLALHTTVYRLNDTGNKLSPLLTTHLDIPSLRIADIIEMDAIHIIITGYFATNLRKIVRRSIIFRIHISIRSDFPDQPRKPTAKRLTPQGIPLTHRNSNYPCMTFHTPFVTLLYRKLQRIITRTFSRKTRQATIPRLIS